MEGIVMGKRGTSQRLVEAEKEVIVELLAQGKTQREVAQFVSKRFRKQVSVLQIKYYAYGRREEIIDKRSNEIELAQDTSIGNLAYRISKLQDLLDEQLKSDPSNVLNIVRILYAADTMMDRAYRRRDRRRVQEDESDNVIDFLEVKRRLNSTKKSIREMKKMGKLVGWNWNDDRK